MLTDVVPTDAAIPFDPTTPEQRENPFDVLALARREQPVFHAPALDLWVVTRHDDVLTVLKDHRTFSSTGALKSSSTSLPPEVLDVLADGFPEMPYIIELDPPLHDRIRGLVARAFTPRRIAELEPRIEAIASELIDELAPRGHADIVEAFAWPLPLRVLGELFGFPREDLEQVHRWGLDWLLLQQAATAGRATRPRPRARRAPAVLRRRRRGPACESRPTTCSARWSPRTTVADEPLSTVEIAGLPLDLMVAGHVTVTRAIGSALDRMFDEPTLREHLLDPELCREGDRGDPPARVAGAGAVPRDHERGRARRRGASGGRARDGALRLGEPRRVRLRGTRTSTGRSATTSVRTSPSARESTSASGRRSGGSSCAWRSRC